MGCHALLQGVSLHLPCSMNFHSVFVVEQLLYTGQGINWEAQGICIRTYIIQYSFIISRERLISPGVRKQVLSFLGSIMNSGKKDVGHEMGERQEWRTPLKAVLDVCFLGFTINRSAECRWDISSE